MSDTKVDAPFTREDVAMLRGLAMYGAHYEAMRNVRAITGNQEPIPAEQWQEGSIEAEIESLASRIEALLPPE